MALVMASLGEDKEISFNNHHLQLQPQSNEPHIATCSSAPHSPNPHLDFTAIIQSYTPLQAGSPIPTRQSSEDIMMASGSKTPHTPQTPWTPSQFFHSPIGTPVRKAITNIKSYLEDVGHLAKFNPQDAWLPITESRTGNAFYSIFHNVNAGIGFQGLLLPYAMFYLGW